MLGILFALAGLLLAGCGGGAAPAPKLATRVTLPMSFRDLVHKSPIVVVSRTLSVETIGGVVESDDAQRFKVQFRRVKASVENVLHGSAPNGEITFYFYSAPQDNPPNGQQLNVIAPGERRILFLDSDNGVLRAVLDVFNSQIEVRSGSHRGFGGGPGESLDQVIASLLLTPGEKVDSESFAAGLATAHFVTTELVGRAPTAELLAALLNSDSPVVRGRACLVLAETAYAQTDCLSKLLNDRDAPALIKPVARDRLDSTIRQASDIIQALTNQPDIWLKQESRSDQPEDRLDLLRLLTLANDDDIRLRACGMLARQFPERPEPRCRQ